MLTGRTRLESVTPMAIEHINLNLCEADKKEIKLSYGQRNQPLAISLSVDVSYYCRLVTVNGTPQVLFGLAGGPNTSTGCIWAYSTESAHDYPYAWLYFGRAAIREGFKTHKHLENYVHKDNEKSIKWLKRLGAQFFEPGPYGLCNENLFMRFAICAEQWQV